MKTLIGLLTKCEFPKRLCAPKTSLFEIENKVGFKLPDDYPYFLENYLEHESYVGSKYLSLWAIEDLLDINESYQVGELLTNALGIGTDFGGSCITLEFTEVTGYKVLCMDFIGFEREYAVKIGTSFTDMLQRLDNGQKWFNKVQS